MVGDNSWLWDTVFPFYKKSPQFTAPDLQKIGPGFDLPYDASAFSPQGGPLQVSFTNYQQPVSPFLAKGMKAISIKEQDGFNSRILNRYATTTVTVDPKSEIRSSSEESFLQTALMKTAMKVYQHTVTEKILFDTTKRAKGVSVVTDGETYTLSAGKEIIVSAGTVSETQGSLIKLSSCSRLVSFPSTAHGLRHWACCNIESQRHPGSLYPRGCWPEPMGNSPGSSNLALSTS